MTIILNLFLIMVSVVLTKDLNKTENLNVILDKLIKQAETGYSSDLSKNTESSTNSNIIYLKNQNHKTIEEQTSNDQDVYKIEYDEKTFSDNKESINGESAEIIIEIENISTVKSKNDLDKEQLSRSGTQEESFDKQMEEKIASYIQNYSNDNLLKIYPEIKENTENDNDKQSVTDKEYINKQMQHLTYEKFIKKIANEESKEKIADSKSNPDRKRFPRLEQDHSWWDDDLLHRSRTAQKLHNNYLLSTHLPLKVIQSPILLSPVVPRVRPPNVVQTVIHHHHHRSFLYPILGRHANGWTGKRCCRTKY